METTITNKNNSQNSCRLELIRPIQSPNEPLYLTPTVSSHSAKTKNFNTKGKYEFSNGTKAAINHIKLNRTSIDNRFVILPILIDSKMTRIYKMYGI